MIHQRDFIMKTIVIIGGNFSGFTTALELKRKLKNQARVIVVDKRDYFLFIPSLIWVPFGRRKVADIKVDSVQVFKKYGVEFVHQEVLSVDLQQQQVRLKEGFLGFDELVIASGPKVDFEVADGLREYAHYIGTPKGAEKMGEALEAFKNAPGPIVIGATQSAGCMGAAYEFLFNIEEWLRAQKIRKKVELYWITPEHYLGHFGIDGIPLGESMLKGFMKMFNIHYITEVGVEKMEQEKIYLTNGQQLDYKLAMLMPPFIGADYVRQSPDLKAAPNGFIPVKENYQHEDYDFVWAAGLAVNVKPPFKAGKVPFSVPKTGYPSDETGKIVAENIYRKLSGKGSFIKKPWGKIPALCVMDAGKKEVIIVANHLFKPRTFAVMIPNVFYDVFKVLFEKYFLWKTKNGYAHLP
ncbi:sulfide:quinone reductase [Persicobacter diffluens]|uniref:Sulfide:quinone reductase n=2 Tax=Persicobacter diffluens TaxID=981 RepID=A0AAN5AII3_9BACT|nr:sulfide:quinone reductase [Persicobacter diffluens]